MIQDMSLELPHRLSHVPDRAHRSVLGWFSVLWLLLAGLMVLDLWLWQAEIFASQSSMGWQLEEDLAKDRESDGKAGKDGTAAQLAAGQLSFGITLVREIPRKHLDYIAPPVLDAPKAFDGTLPPPPKYALDKPTPQAIKGPGDPNPQSVKGSAEGAADIASTNGAGEAGAPSAGGNGMGNSDAAAPGANGSKGAGTGRGGKGLTGQRVAGDAIAALITGWTLIGSEGAFDGSEPSPEDMARNRIPWQVYYAPDGTLQARWTMLYARKPHAPLELITFNERGTWNIQGDDLCQSIKRWGYGLPVCFHMHKAEQAGQTALALYYGGCGGLTRCYAGRLGPEGIIYQGKIGFDD